MRTRQYSLSALIQLAVIVVLGLGFLTTCDNTGDLEAVSGVQGVVKIVSSWPDSLKGAVVVVFDVALDLDRLNDSDYVVIDHFITFSDPIQPGLDQSEYFIQLQPGGYLIMTIGLLVKPAQLLADPDMFQQIQKYIVLPENAMPRGIVIQKGQINYQDAWSVQF